VLLAVAICAASSLTCFHAYSHVTRGQDARRLAWVFLTAVCTGAGIWATHFVAMLAYNPGFSTGYQPELTIASLLIAAVIAMVGFGIAARGGGLRAAAAGGAVIGAGIAAMHFTGMQALVVPGTLVWDGDLVVSSILIGIALTSAALVAWHGLERRLALWASPALLTAAICGLHFTAMGAVTIVPDPGTATGAELINSSTLAVAVTAVTGLVMLALLAMTLITSKGEREARIRNQELVDAALEGLIVADRGRVVDVNSRILNLTGRSSDDLKGRRVFGDLLVGAFGSLAANGSLEASLQTAAGLPIPVEVVCRPLGGSSRANEVYAVHDLTERHRLNAQLELQNRLLKEREEDLRIQNANLDTALANMMQGLAMFDADERLVLANQRYAEFYDLEPEHIRPGTALTQIVHHRIAKGLYQGYTADQILRDMRERIERKCANRLTTNPGNGRTLQVSVAPREGGGWVVTLEDVTEREDLNVRLTQQNKLLEKREEEIKVRSEQLDAALENMSQGLAMFDADQRLVVCNRRYAEMYGLTPNQVKPGTTVRQIFQYRLANGSYQIRDTEGFIDSWAKDFGEVSSRMQELANGRIVKVSRRRTANGGRVVTHDDITEREQLNARLEQQNEVLKEHERRLGTQNLVLDAALNNMVQGLAMFDAEERLVICNERYVEMYGLSPEQAKPGTSVQSIIEHRIARGEFPGKTAEEHIRAMRKRLGDNKTADYMTQLSDGRHIAVTVQPMASGGTVTTHHDITVQRRSEAKIEHMALHDTLTGLPNRVLLNERLEQALAHVKRGEIVAVHLLDLDNFKTVNDTLGHAAGDKLLKQVAERLRALVRETDTIARMGGDEFAIVQGEIVQPGDATALAYRAIEAVSKPYSIDGREMVIGTSVGIAVGPTDGATADQLMRNADLALYRAKGDGRRTYRFFEAEMDAQMQARRVLEDNLRKALPAGEFELHYQPVFNLQSDEVSGFEALIRWRSGDQGLVPPGMFISLAEEIGFIVPLGEWAIRQACATAAGWPGNLKVAVNLSPVQFRGPGLVEVVVGALAASGLPAERLELEITETILLDNSEETLSTLYQLRALGVRIAMDDFGTGYASLSYLQCFPFDKIKIDRSFVKDIADGVGSLNIVRAVTAMATGLGMATTAEGVETPEQLEAVRAEGCTEMQGYLFSGPLTPSEVPKFLSTWNKEKVRKARAKLQPRKAADAA
jgi:diguanylate cyclase (GGDEF)-like protein